MSYLVVLNCTVTQTVSPSPTGAWVLPSTSVVVPYGLTEGGIKVTDSRSPPTVSFGVSNAEVAALQTATVLLPLVSQIVQLAPSTLPAATLTEAVAANANNAPPLAKAFAYSEALAFLVELADPNAQLTWQVVPRAVVLVATALNASTGAGWVPVNTSAPLPSGWCGLGVDAVAAIALPAGGTPASWTATLNASLSSGTLSSLSALYGASPGFSLPTLQSGLANATAADALPVADPTGGLAVPLVNRLTVNGVPGTYGLRMCALVELVPYQGVSLSGYFPLFPTAAAAARAAPGTPTVVRLGALSYYLPASADVLCAPASANISGALPPTDANCVAAALAPLPPASARRRRALLAAVEQKLGSTQSGMAVMMQTGNSPGASARSVQLTGMPPSSVPAGAPPSTKPAPSSSSSGGGPGTALIISGSVVAGVAVVGLLVYAYFWRRTAAKGKHYGVMRRPVPTGVRL